LLLQLIVVAGSPQFELVASATEFFTFDSRCH
jgi:hypothetical protein